MQWEGNWYDTEDWPKNQYRYNGKELNSDFGLDWYAYGARWYDAGIGRFTGLDPISDRFPHLSTFNYASNDPVKNIDLHGLQGVSSTRGSTPSVAGILFEAFQNARAGLFNMEMRVAEFFGRGDGNTVARMRVNYDEYGGVSIGNPIKIVQEPKKGALAEAGDTALDMLSFTPLTELGIAGREMSAPFLAAKSGAGSGFTSLYRAVSQAELDDIAEHGIRVSPDGRGYQ